MKRVLNRAVPVLVLVALVLAMLPMLACNGSDGNEDTALDHVDKGDAYAENQQWDEAIEEYGKAIELDADLITAYFNRATAYSMEEQYDSAVADLNKVIDESSDPGLVQQAEQLADELKPMALRKTLDETASQTAEVRELAPKSEVEYDFVTNDELREYLIEQYEEEYPEEEIGADQEVYVLLDFMEADQDLYSILLDVLSEQVIGFYDDDSRKMFLVSEREEFGLLDKIVFAHEYTHALQDQHFDLSSLPLDLEDNSDIALAALALVEGDAVLSMNNYMRENLDMGDLVAILQEAQQVDQGELDSAPQFIQKELLFPYEAGLEFVLELELWGGINAAYAELPESTEQILHPEKYMERDSPQEVSMPDIAPALGQEWAQLDSDTLGELYVGIYLDTYIADVMADTAAAGWDGDRYVYLKSTDGEKVLAWRTTWDSDADSGEFFDAYVAYIAEKSRGAWDLCLEDDMARLWSTDGQSVYLGASGSDALVVIAPDAIAAQKVVAEFPEFPAADSACQ